MPEQREQERICLFGGTFDPIHIAHLRIANEAMKNFSLNRVLFVPAACPPHKNGQTVTPFEDRFRMVEIACAPYPSFVASRLEAGERPNYTIDTVERFRKDLLPEDELFFLIGADAFNEISSWHRWEELISLIQFIVVSRPGQDYVVPEGAVVYRLEGLELPTSSSAIREHLAEGESEAEVPVEVRDYIFQRGLYGAR
ncbi:MAG: nicotinate-nucleotide adenylyltransferase [Bryobacterales bacterium]|nr:nicotinate-nucleotide adenylyltransferase [Bryobacterales bacterium]